VEWASGASTPKYDDLYNGSNKMAMPWNNPAEAVKPETMNSLFGNAHMATCTMAQELAVQFQTGVAAVLTLDGDGNSKEGISEMHKQFLYYLILHEMGHTLGLNHNMKASQMLSPAQVND